MCSLPHIADKHEIELRDARSSDVSIPIVVIPPTNPPKKASIVFIVFAVGSSHLHHTACVGEVDGQVIPCWEDMENRASTSKLSSHKCESSQSHVPTERQSKKDTSLLDLTVTDNFRKDADVEGNVQLQRTTTISGAQRARSAARSERGIVSTSSSVHRFEQADKNKLGQRLAILISKIHFTAFYKHDCHVGDQATDCKLGLFQDASYAE